MPNYALRFISGKYQGGEFPLRMDREIIIGRSSDLDMVLVEDMVSRKHAKIETKGGQVIIQDLGSTNGTFVNGEKIKKVRLKEGDRVLVGTSIIKLVAVEGSTPMDTMTEGEARERMAQKADSARQTALRPMSGTIEEVPLPDLLQLFGTSKKSGVLVVRNSNDHMGRIYLRRGQLYYCNIDDSFDIGPRKAIYRLLTWTEGSFELEPPDNKEFLEEISESVEAVLMEGLRQLDELHRIDHEIPAREAQLILTQPMVPALRDLQPAELDTLQLVFNYGSTEIVLNKSTLTDLETYQVLLTLMKRDYVRQG
jgi:hypothetical protein